MEEMKWKKKMIEEAEEELERLESEHPHNFNALKMDLKSLISHIFHHSISLSDLLLHNTNHNSHTPSASTATTQESSCRKRKSRKQIPSAITVAGGLGERNRRRLCDDRRVEGVLHRAQLCLHTHSKQPSSSTKLTYYTFFNMTRNRESQVL